MTTRQRQPPNYKNGCVYKLCCKDPNIDKIYVGSTVNFKARKSKHKSVCNNIKDKDYNAYVYKFIRENGGFENWDMIQIEAYEAKDKRDLETRERYYIELLKSSLNRQIPTQTVKEYHKKYYEDNKEKMKEYYEDNKADINKKVKEYYEDNKADINKKVKEYYKQNKEEIKEKMKEYREKNKEILKQKKKEYHEKNKEILKQKKKEYYEKHKDKINEMRKKIVKCSHCNKELTKSNLTRHIKNLH